MPVNLVDNGKRPTEYDPQYQLQRRAQTAEAVASLAQAYQSYQSNRRDRTLMDELLTNSPSGPLAQARSEQVQQPSGPQIQIPQGVNGAQPTFIGQAQLAAQNQANGVNPQAPPQQGGILSRARSMFSGQNGAPLSPMELLIAQSRIKQLYPDTSKGYKPRTMDEAVLLEKEKAKAKASAYSHQPLQPGYKIGPDGKVRSDKDYVSAASEMKKLDIAELKKMQETLPALDQANRALDQLEQKYYEGFNPDEGAASARVWGVGKSISAMAGLNPSGKTYINNKKAFSGLISKGGFGEKGVLTNQDIERVTNALPNEYSTKEEAKQAFQEVRSILAGARQRYESKKEKVFGGGSEGNQSKGSLDPNTAAQFLKQAGGDKEKAREMAKQAGYQF